MSREDADPTVPTGQRSKAYAVEMPAPLPAVADIAQVIFSLLDQRRADATICPSEVARAMHASRTRWRAAMPRVREVAALLAARGLLRVTRRGQEVEATSTGGPIRLGRPK